MLKVINHTNISNEILNEIIAIKNCSWKYTAEQHLSWISENLTDDDLHFLHYEGEELIGYMNLVKVSIESDSTVIPCLGIGNVCTKFKKSGHGKILMSELNNYLQDTNQKGLLFCKDELVLFYKKHGWIVVDTVHLNKKINTMLFNFSNDEGVLTYKERIF